MLFQNDQFLNLTVKATRNITPITMILTQFIKSLALRRGYFILEYFKNVLGKEIFNILTLAKRNAKKT